MTIEDLLRTFKEDREKHEFLSDENAGLVEIEGYVKSEAGTPVWGLVNANNFSRINIDIDKQYITLYKKEKDNSNEKEYSYGIYFSYNPRRVVKTISYNEEAQKLTITVSEDAVMTFYNSENQTIYERPFKKWSGDLEKPVTGSDISSMDSKSPTHEDPGITRLRPFGQI